MKDSNPFDSSPSLDGYDTKTKSSTLATDQDFQAVPEKFLGMIRGRKKIAYGIASPFIPDFESYSKSYEGVTTAEIEKLKN